MTGSHRRAVPSALAVATLEPSGLNRAFVTLPLWPMKTPRRWAATSAERMDLFGGGHGVRQRESLVPGAYALHRVGRLEQRGRVLRGDHRPDRVALCLGVAPGVPDVPPADQGRDQEREHDGEADQPPRPQPPPLLLEFLALLCLFLRPLPALLVLTAPLDHGAGQHVVPDLETGRLLPRRRVDRAEDPTLVELLENRLGDLQRHAGVAGEVVGACGRSAPPRA